MRSARRVSWSTRSMKRFGHTIKEHTLTVPWDYTDPTAGSFELYAREIVPPGGMISRA